jgi:ketosteroid isomerase-like protein
MLDQPFAEDFASDWLEAWNSHDLDRVLSHYADAFEMSSPLIVQLAGEASGTLKGKVAVRAFWAKALEQIPGLRFDLLDILLGVDSLTLYYEGAKGRLVAEVFHFDAERKVIKAYAHYAV